MPRGHPRNIANRFCINCNDQYRPVSTSQKYCKSCVIECLKESARLRKKRNYNAKTEEYCKREKERSLTKRINEPLLACYNGARDRARSLGIEFTITLEDLIQPDVCPVFKQTFKRKTPFAMSIDRIDNDKGYIPGNVQVISRLANSMKNNATPDQLREFADWIYKNYKTT